jgi:hypothetical protein
MQIDFLAGRYEAVRWALRFTWESIYRSLFADRFRELRPNAPDPPGPTVDEKAAWLGAPGRKLDWNTVEVVLRHVFRQRSNDPVAEFKPMWDRLNRAAHPSGEWRASGVEASARHVWHHFDGTQACEVIADARVVFGVVFVAILTHFPKVAVVLAVNPHVFGQCPAVRLFLRGDSRVTT